MIRFLLGALIIALLTAAGFVLAGIGFITQQAWWAFTGIGAGAVALLLMALYFSPWLLAGIAISAGILYAGTQALPRQMALGRETRTLIRP
jgi:predicted exporter